MHAYGHACAMLVHILYTASPPAFRILLYSASRHIPALCHTASSLYAGPSQQPASLSAICPVTTALLLSAFKRLDLVIFYANKYGVRVIFPLVNYEPDRELSGGARCTYAQCVRA